MVVEKILGHFHETDKDVDTVSIEWFERDKKILKKTSKKGTEIGIRPDRPLNDGDILYEDENSIIAVEMAECELIKINVSDIMEMGRLCFEIGNRHISLSIKPDCVKIPYDAPTYEYLTKLGFDTKKVVERFTDYTECKGHAHRDGHGHSHTHEGNHHEY
ncbi:MAG TPA: urease accessory protein UreE [Candidatus Mediterraneibacter norfolkensis]|nr:urease accessory protein UreE [Candidatus Mediterraneibacter norfolkensis]